MFKVQAHAEAVCWQKKETDVECSEREEWRGSVHPLPVYVLLSCGASERWAAIKILIPLRSDAKRKKTKR